MADREKVRHFARDAAGTRWAIPLVRHLQVIDFIRTEIAENDLFSVALGRMNLDPLLNDFALRSFREIADGDYIAARLSFRAQLVPQFLWQSRERLAIPSGTISREA